MLVIICGLPGIGKTTLAKEISPLLDAVVLSTDKIRKELFPKPTYEKAERELVYEVMTLVAKYLLKARKNCILDGTFNKEKSRKEVIKKLGLSPSQVYIVECSCPENTIISRLKLGKREWSDADVGVYKKMKKIYEPVMLEHITADTSMPPKTTAKKVVQLIQS